MPRGVHLRSLQGTVCVPSSVRESAAVRPFSVSPAAAQALRASPTQGGTKRQHLHLYHSHTDIERKHFNCLPPFPPKAPKTCPASPQSRRRAEACCSRTGLPQRTASPPPSRRCRSCTPETRRCGCTVPWSTSRTRWPAGPLIVTVSCVANFGSAAVQVRGGLVRVHCWLDGCLQRAPDVCTYGVRRGAGRLPFSGERDCVDSARTGPSVLAKISTRVSLASGRLQ